MSLSSRSAVAIHALTMLARWSDKSLTSAEIAESLASNPVLVRRVLGSLRDADLVRSTEGRGGGWTLARAPRAITLHDAYLAVETGPLLSRHPHPPNDACEVGRNMQALLESEFQDAERAMAERLGRTTIADLVTKVLAIEREAGLSR
ncbi:Rrf2 family protein [Saccharopolyspora antimicrobica]|uniref:Rrf2 family protein n=1 Tax=Saccharopolyspora antimicrobica TaxID=455193 RepID=A0A1I5L8X3_9PSEU|nr:Rrf2 family transcriptional regulator [Saccharopolyspora antimicrobica]RKT86862.1 Rrf2 family protein [Saccharopolyspora antimicrobica]SFO93306.1 Rrf2 family protein [Saccharopolyspora antimicrobica]